MRGCVTIGKKNKPTRDKNVFSQINCTHSAEPSLKTGMAVEQEGAKETRVDGWEDAAPTIGK